MVNPDLLARLGRRWLRRQAAQRRVPEIPIEKKPVLFGNSFPKSGTHLLTQILAGLPQMGPVVESGLPPIVTFVGDTGHPRSQSEILLDLARLLPGGIGYGSLHGGPENVW